MAQPKELSYGHIKDRMKKFTELLRKSSALVLINSNVDKVTQIKLVENRKAYERLHYFDASGVIEAGNCHHSINIDDSVIKKIITPKSNIFFNVNEDAFTNDLCRAASLHADGVYVRVDKANVLLDVSIGQNNSARLINY